MPKIGHCIQKYHIELTKYGKYKYFPQSKLQSKNVKGVIIYFT